MLTPDNCESLCSRISKLSKRNQLAMLCCSYINEKELLANPKNMVLKNNSEGPARFNSNFYQTFT